MTGRSLRARFAIAAVLTISLVLALAGVGLVALFERHVERRIGSELTAQLNALTAAIVIEPDGAVTLQPRPVDPRFRRPLSGLYWQVEDANDSGPDRIVLRSRSLWDSSIALPPDRPDPGAVHSHRLPGPGGQQLLARERRILLDDSRGIRALRLAVAVDRRELILARRAFAADMLPYLLLLSALLGAAGLIQIRAGLAPLETVRRGVGAIRSGGERRLSGDFPAEVMPLVSEVNALLEAREQAIERARTWTADLAHGLKTPLSALAADADKLRARGDSALAADLEQLADTMRRRVDRELIRARVRSGAETRRARADVSDAIAALLRTLRRTPDGERLQWQVEAPVQTVVAITPEDLLELLGNLLENAAKWASSRVDVDVDPAPTSAPAKAPPPATRSACEARLERLSEGTPEALGGTSSAPPAAAPEPYVSIVIRDDGPGVADSDLPRLGQRGTRLDERRDGSGLGLAIVRDVADAYGGSVIFGAAPGGGLEVRVSLPAAAR